MTSRKRTLLLETIVVSLGICIFPAQRGQTVEPTYFAVDLHSTLDSQAKHSLTIGLLEAGESEIVDTVPPPEVSGFDFHIASVLAWPWDRLSVYLVPKVPGETFYHWTVVVVAPAGQETVVSWDASGAPAELSLYFTELDLVTGEPVGEPQDMKTTTSVSVAGGSLAPVTRAFEFQMHVDLLPPRDFAKADHATETGAITAGSYEDTHDQDDLAEALTDAVLEKGKPSKRHDELSHVWTFEVTGGASVVFFVDACKAASPDGDDFLFSYSTDGVAYEEMLTVSTTIDNDTYQCCALPGSLNGTVYVRAQDTDRSAGNQSPDTLYVDHMFILCGDSSPDLPPEAPRNLVAVGGVGEVTLDWDDNSESDLNHYHVYRSSSPEGPSEWLGSALESVYVDNDVVDGISYYYRVTAVDEAGQESAFSNMAGAVAGASPLIRVASIEMSTATTGRKWQAIATVTVLCRNGYPVEGATVSYTWSGVHKGIGEALTGSDGVATVVSGSSPKSGVTVFTVTNVSKADRVFDEAGSAKSSSVTGP